MTRKSAANEPLNANFGDLASLGTRQAEAFLEAQSAFTQTLQEANRHWMNRVQNEGQLATELLARLSGARTVPEVTQAWQEWAQRHSDEAAEDVRRIVTDGQSMWKTAARAFAGGWASPVLVDESSS